jgi:hypothetical protein
MTFEGNMGDGRENDNSHIVDRIAMFMEMLGLKREFAPGRFG